MKAAAKGVRQVSLELRRQGTPRIVVCAIVIWKAIEGR